MIKATSSPPSFNSSSCWRLSQVETKLDDIVTILLNPEEVVKILQESTPLQCIELLQINEKDPHCFVKIENLDNFSLRGVSIVSQSRTIEIYVNDSYQTTVKCSLIPEIESLDDVDEPLYRGQFNTQIPINGVKTLELKFLSLFKKERLLISQILVYGSKGEEEIKPTPVPNSLPPMPSSDVSMMMLMSMLGKNPNPNTQHQQQIPQPFFQPPFNPTQPQQHIQNMQHLNRMQLQMPPVALEPKINSTNIGNSNINNNNNLVPPLSSLPQNTPPFNSQQSPGFFIASGIDSMINSSLRLYEERTSTLLRNSLQILESRLTEKIVKLEEKIDKLTTVVEKLTVLQTTLPPQSETQPTEEQPKLGGDQNGSE